MSQDTFSPKILQLLQARAEQENLSAEDFLVHLLTSENPESTLPYSAVLDYTTDIIALIDLDLRHVYVNKVIERITGLNPQEMIGKTNRELGMPEEQVIYWETMHREVIKSGVEQVLKFEFPSPEGLRYYESRTAPIKAPDGQIIYILSIARDITAYKEAQLTLLEKEASLTYAQASARLGSWTFDVLKKEIWWSAQLFRLFYLEPADQAPDFETYFGLIHPDDRARVESDLEKLFQGENVESYIHRSNPVNGPIRYLFPTWEAVYSPEGQLIKFRGTLQDITERIETEQRIKKLNRVYAVLSNINQTIVRTRDLGQLFQNACQIAVEDGGMLMAWIGLIDESGRLSPVASAGVVDNYLERIAPFMNDAPNNTGPMGHTLRQGECAICNDISTDPGMMHVRELALSLGYRALATFPLIVSDKIRGIIALYTGEAFFFDDEEMQLLDELALDISFAMEINERETQRQIAEEHVRYQADLIENISDSIISTDLNFMIRSWNQAAENLYGWAADEVIGRSFNDIVMTEYPYDVAENVLEEFLTNGIWRGEVIQNKRTGERLNVLTSVSLTRDANHQPTGVVSINRDISEHKKTEAAIRQLNTELENRVIERTAQLSQARERIETILNSSSEVIILCWDSGIIEQVNPAFDMTFQCDADEVLFQSLFDLVVPTDQSRLKWTFEQVIKTQLPERLEVTAACQARFSFEADVMLSPILQGEDKRLIGVVCSLRDISERKQMEANLRQMLEHQMQLSELKSRYVAMAAHDLRNPLAVIQASVSMLYGYGDRLTADRKQAKYEQIQTSIKLMTDMLNDILTIGKVDAGQHKFNPVPLDVVAFCHDILDELKQTEGLERQIIFSLSDKHTCGQPFLDARLLRHILNNLLNNALKYSEPESVVTFTLNCDKSDWIHFTVQDHGIGIPLADQLRLFEAFQRGSNARHIPGTGLGLAIVKQSVDIHGGEIEFESQENVGTTFIIRLPIEPPLPKYKP